jgi:hypothetical protein
MLGHEALPRRFWAKVEEDERGCWIWTGAKTTGYGRYSPPKAKRLVLAHRYAFENLVGPVPAGLDLDHLCRTRACVNPAHLEPVTRQVNLLRGDTLARAHHEGRDCGFDRCKNCRRFRAARAAA